MNKNILIAIGVGILVFAGGGFLVASQQNKTSDEAMMKKDEATMEKKEGEAMTEKTDDKMMKSDSSRYVEYSKAVFDQGSDKRRVLYFYANWCPVCRPLDNQISENSSNIPSDVVILRVNYNDSDTDQEEKDLAKKYDISYQHTFVQIDTNGNQINKWSGGDFDGILGNIK